MIDINEIPGEEILQYLKGLFNSSDYQGVINVYDSLTYETVESLSDEIKGDLWGLYHKAQELLEKKKKEEEEEVDRMVKEVWEKLIANNEIDNGMSL